MTKFTSTSAMRFVILMGLVSLFSDMTYEGARSITAPYLAVLGANAAAVGFVAGFGELIGYALRLVSGYLADRTRQYWTLTLLGYFCNLLAVPLLALAGQWLMAAILMTVERMGKAVRTPARDAMLSHACQEMGMGWGFGLHEALDQTGAMLGPLIVAIVLYFKGGYRQSFAVLLIPAIAALLVLFLARFLYPHPHDLETKKDHLKTEGMRLPFWLYVLGASLVAAGFADFPLVAYHFEKKAVFSATWIPILYAFAMGMNAMTSPILGKLYDRRGFSILIFVTLATCFFAPCVFLGGERLIILGIALWSIGMGAHESLIRAIVANMASADKRASAYGIFNMSYGVSWFLGSVLMGILYDKSMMALVIFSLAIQLLAIPIFYGVVRINAHT